MGVGRGVEVGVNTGVTALLQSLLPVWLVTTESVSSQSSLDWHQPGWRENGRVVNNAVT